MQIAFQIEVLQVLGSILALSWFGLSLLIHYILLLPLAIKVIIIAVVIHLLWVGVVVVSLSRGPSIVIDLIALRVEVKVLVSSLVGPGDLLLVRYYDISNSTGGFSCSHSL